MNDSIYQAWHRELGHAEYRLSITMEGYGADEDAAEAFLCGFEQEHPEVGAVISQNSAEDTITAIFSLSANSDLHALKLGAAIWVEAGVASGLVPKDVIRTETELVNGEREQAEHQSAVLA